jgi:hypothetical protein
LDRISSTFYLPEYVKRVRNRTRFFWQTNTVFNNPPATEFPEKPKQGIPDQKPRCILNSISALRADLNFKGFGFFHACQIDFIKCVKQLLIGKNAGQLPRVDVLNIVVS